MGRNPTPKAILDARGGFINRPSRERPDEPSTENKEPLGSPPSYLSLEEKKVWKRLAKELLPGVAFASDRSMFAELVVLTTMFETRQPMKAAERSLRFALAARFAMTPADRSRVVAEKPKESSLSKFLSRRTDPVQ
jgi:phage terminase small subunit